MESPHQNETATLLDRRNLLVHRFRPGPRVFWRFLRSKAQWAFGRTRRMEVRERCGNVRFRSEALQAITNSNRKRERERGLAPCPQTLGLTGYEDGTVPVPFSRGPCRRRLVRRESGTGTKAANSMVCYSKSISLLWSQSHFHASIFSLSNRHKFHE